MNDRQLRALVDEVARGAVDPETASERLVHALRERPFEDLGFARVDHHRSVRQGFPEVVAGLHRLLSERARLTSARVIIVVAGMEGALPSVVSGLVSVPVVAVPTSIGYGASFGGIAALLGMLNSCASGVSVVNIDNGFGAATVASLINHL